MTYEACLTAIHSRKAFSSCATLERISRLMERLGNPQNAIRCVHVAGTNGKGSICALVESALRRSGYRVGLFTSPYLLDFRERIQIDRQMIGKKLLVSCFEAVMKEERLLEDAGFEPINEFELVTAIGFVAFAKSKVDFAVIEVGLGGRCDATNVIAAPIVSCIASISLDHTAILGDTVAKIAVEKAGIIKPGRPVVLARQVPEAREVLLATAQERGSRAVEAALPQLLQEDKRGLTFLYRSEQIQIPLLGRYQMDNAAAAWEVCALLGLDGDAVKEAFHGVLWPGRLQYIPGTPELLIDSGHNPAGIQALCQTIDELFSDHEIIAVMGMMKDKDYQRCIPMVAGRCKTLIAATVGLPRSLAPEELAREAAPFCRTRTAASVSEGLRTAKTLWRPGKLIVVCGSVYGAGAALQAIS